MIMAYTLADHKRRFVHSPTGYYTLTAEMLPNVSQFAWQLLRDLPRKVRHVAERGWLKVANGVPVHAYDGMHDKVRANAWLEKFAAPFLNGVLPLDFETSDDDIIAFAKRTANRFERGIVFHAWDMTKQCEKAAALGVDWDTQFAKQIKNGWHNAIAARLCDVGFWKRHFRRQIGRELENIYRGHCGLVHKRKWLYVSDDAVTRRRQQKARNAAIMQMVTLMNELGQTFQLSELVEKSNANPAIRRAELMVRIAGFEAIARDVGHCGEFITITCPSRFHSAMHYSGSLNLKYDGSNPRQANDYLCGVWARIQTALAREGIEIYGFRVVEPHHDGCPHWHGLFFMEKQHRKRFRQIVALHACRADRKELDLTYFETKKARTERAREIQAKQKAKPELFPHVQTLATISGSLKLENDVWENADSNLFHKVKARVDFEAINWKKGTAAGYIAKYIAKNIDGKNALGESVGDDYETDGEMSVVETAERVDAWASLWGIRQFQQIGGAPVSVWRELRREFADDTQDDSDIIRAARAADLGDWGKFIQVMGGIAMKRSDRPVQLYKETPMRSNGEVWRNRYGEPMEKSIRGVFDLSTGEIRLTRVHEWTLTFEKGAKAPAWTCVNNSTKFKSGEEKDSFVKKSKEVEINYAYFLSKVSGSLTAERRADLERELFTQNQILDDFKSGQFREMVQAENALTGEMLATIRHFERTGKLPNGKTPQEQAWENYQKYQQNQLLSKKYAQEYEVIAKSAERVRKKREYCEFLDKLSPPVSQLTVQYRNEQREQAELRQKIRQPVKPERKFKPFVAPETTESLLVHAQNMLNDIQAEIDELWDF